MLEHSLAGKSLRDAAPLRPRWADLQDSSQENPDSQPAPPLSQGSYNDEPVEDSQEEVSRVSLPEVLELSALLQSPPTTDATAQPGHGGAATATAPAQPADVGSVPPVAAVSRELTAEPLAEPPAEPLVPLSWRLRAWGREVASGRQVAPPPKSPPTTPARRRRRNETEVQTAMQTPLGKRSRGGPAPAPPPAPDASKEEWARRLQKRRAAIAAIKRMPEYSACTEGRLSGLLGDDEVPLTPEPDDCTVSKRQWEAAVMQWRALLKRLALPTCLDLDSSSHF